MGSHGGQGLMAEDSTTPPVPSNKQLLQEEAPLAAVYTNSSSLHWIPKEIRHLVSTEVFPSGEKKFSKEFQDPFENFIAVLGCLRLEHVL